MRRFSTPGAQALAAGVLYLLLAAAATWPLLRDMGTRIVSDPGDPILNTSILVWNATTIPYTERWWNAPHYNPTPGVTTLTENLLGASPLASPVYWLTGNGLLAHNLSIFLTWPLSGLAVFLLVRQLTGRADAAFLAGLAFQCTPYRAMAYGHLQTLATFGIPLMLLGLHGFLADGRRRWLFLFGLAWIQQGLANGYYILYGGLIAGLWLLYFCARARAWRRGMTIVAAWAIASVPLVPLLLRYRRVHDDLGLHRSLNEIQYYSANVASWFQVDSKVWLWHAVFPEGKDNLFPGLTIVLLAAAGIAVALLRRRQDPIEGRGRRGIRIALAIVAALSLIAVVIGLRYGRINLALGGLTLHQRTIGRPLLLLVLAVAGLAPLTPRLRDAVGRRSPLVFYAAMSIVFAMLACGPVLYAAGDAILDPAPYGWLMRLPGFNELRTPTQIKMIDIACLAVAGGLAFASLRLTRMATIACVAAGCGLVLDGWMIEVPMVAAPSLWPVAEPTSRSEPILELPLGPGTDFGSTYRASIHHRRVFNGVSGYDPPHYAALREGLAERDPKMLDAIASLGAFDIVVDRSSDRDGALARYAAAAPGARQIADDGERVVFEVPRTTPRPALGAPLPIVGMRAVRHESDAVFMHDGRIETKWGDAPQFPDQWIIADLGGTHQVGGITNVIGDSQTEFPRRLGIDVSLDGTTWERVWQGDVAADAFLAYVRDPRGGSIEIAFPPRQARFVRLQQLASHPRAWWVLELIVHAATR